MYKSGALDLVPLWGLFVATTVIIALSVEVGFRLGRERRRRSEAEKETPVGAMVAATLGLLGFMLAFTFGLAAARFDTRRLTVLEEANAIGTSYLRAAMLPEPERSDSRRMLRAYVDIRMTGIDPLKVQAAIAASTALHAQLWNQAITAAKKDPRSVPTGLYIQSLNEVIDLHSKRIMVGLRNRVPGTIWAALYFVAMLAMAQIGYHEGLTSTRRSPAAIALVLTFSCVLLLIADLDRPLEGMLRISQQSMIDLHNSLERSAP